MSGSLLVTDINNTPIGEYRLEGRLAIGRAPDSHVVLDSPYISPEHAEVIQEGPTVSIRALGLNGLLVNDEDLRQGQTRQLANQDVISIPGFLLQVNGLRSTKAAEDFELEEQFSEIKREIHGKLLDNVRFKGRVIDANDEALKGELDGRLEQLLSRVETLDKELLNYVVKRAVREEVISNLMRGEAKEGRRMSLSWSVSQHAIAFDELSRTILRELNQSGATDNGLLAVRSAFNDAYARYETALNNSDQHFVAKACFRQDINDLVYGLGPLESLLTMGDITEIMVVGRKRIFVERGGGLEETGRSFPSEDDLGVAVNRMVRPIGRAVSRADPIIDARLLDGSRVHVVVPPIAIHGTSVTIRRFREDPFRLEDLLRFGSLTPQAGLFITALARARKNIVVSGGTGSGKTTLLNVIGSLIPMDQRLVVIEDSAELQLPQPNQVNLEARKANLEGAGEISIKDLVRASLRMRPDRVVVGECRGGEALDMLQAMNTGHDGSLTTGHANSPVEMMQRLQVMVMEAGEDMPASAIRQQIASAVDVVVQIARQRDRSRKITHISEVAGYDFDREQIIIEDIFRLTTQANGTQELTFTGYLPSFIQQLLDNGGVTLEELFAWS
jgi:pilus assembly protein CpaF